MGKTYENSEGQIVHDDRQYYGYQLQDIPEGTIFYRCIFDHASFVAAKLNNIIFDACILVDVCFIECDLNNVVFKNRTGMRHVYFDKASRIQNVDVTGIVVIDSQPIVGGNDDARFIREPGYSKCPETGAFEAWKIVEVNGADNENRPYSAPILARLRIPEDAKRSNAFDEKCRASKAICLKFYTLDGTEITDMTEELGFVRYSVVSPYRSTDRVQYSPGKVVKAENWDPRWWLECAGGIHFFMKKEEAVNYLKSFQ